MQIPPMKIYFSTEDRKEILLRVGEALSMGQLVMGTNIDMFEKKFADYCGVKHAIAVSSGSSAIEIFMRAVDVKNAEVLIPTNTFLATAAGVLLAGGNIRLVDVDPETFSLNVKNLKNRLTSTTIGVVIVHIGGIITPEIDEIRGWCFNQGLWLFEDAAHAHGSVVYGKKAGTFGLAGAYSFFATKTMTSGEGGMLVTDEPNLAWKAKLLRNHGKPNPWESYHTHLGSNWRMSELNAIVGLTQLKKLDEFIEYREKVARIYTEKLSGKPGLSLILPYGRSSWYKYIVLLDKNVDKNKLKIAMKEQGVNLPGEVYETPLHNQPVFADLIDGNFPIADEICSQHICLPMYYGMTNPEISFVVKTLLTSLK